MSAILGSAVTGAGGGAYTIDNSLRFRSSASALLSRAFGGAGTLTTWTWSAWVKRGTLSTQARFMSCNGTASDRFVMLSDDTIEFTVGGGRLTTTQVFRDPSSWYHIVIVWDTTQATAANRFKLYVNGSQVTALSTATYPAQNNTSSFGAANTWVIGAGSTGALEPFDGYMAEVNYVNNQALTPSSFGATNASTGVWQPKAYSGSYGTNGFYLKFSDIATTSGANSGLGKDFSGNGNYFNTSNISVTAGITYDAMTDSPTPKSATVGNFATLNPILQNGWWAAPSRGSISYGNLRLSQNNGTAFSTFDVNTSGKWYCELTITSYGQASASSEIIVSAYSRNTFEVAYYRNGNKSVNNTVTAYGATWTTGDVIGIAIDKTNNQVTFYKNNVSQGTITNTFPSETVLVGYYAEATGTDTVDFNFGQRPFTYTPPSGFNRLCSYNLPTPTIGASSTTQASNYFSPVLWTGTGTAQTISGLGFSPDMTWIKSRSVSGNHHIFDTVRAVGTYPAVPFIQSNNTNAQAANGDKLDYWTSDGFHLGGSGEVDGLGVTFVAWNWKGNGSGSSNTSGTVTSTVSANTTCGFSIVKVTSPNGGTVGHGLGVAPDMMIAKRTDAVSNWMVQNRATGVGYTILQSTQAYAGGDPSVWNGQFPSSSVIYTASGGYFASGTFIIYCFATVAGFSKFGTYAGNGSTDGPFVYTGFKPKFVMIKRTDSADNWFMTDGTRDTYNTTAKGLEANLSDAENTGNSASSPFLDYLSNGFKLRQSSTGMNGSGGTYQYMAFAENPFNYSLAR